MSTKYNLYWNINEQEMKKGLKFLKKLLKASNKMLKHERTNENIEFNNNCKYMVHSLKENIKKS